MNEPNADKQSQPVEEVYFVQRCPHISDELPGCPGCISFCPEFLDKVRLALRLSAEEISDDDLISRIREALVITGKVQRGELYSKEEMMSFEAFGDTD